jgi:hypothetical protein
MATGFFKAVSIVGSVDFFREDGSIFPWFLESDWRIGGFPKIWGPQEIEAFYEQLRKEREELYRTNEKFRKKEDRIREKMERDRQNKLFFRKQYLHALIARAQRKQKIRDFFCFKWITRYFSC